MVVFTENKEEEEEEEEGARRSRMEPWLTQLWALLCGANIDLCSPKFWDG